MEDDIFKIVGATAGYGSVLWGTIQVIKNALGDTWREKAFPDTRAGKARTTMLVFAVGVPGVLILWQVGFVPGGLDWRGAVVLGIQTCFTAMGIRAGQKGLTGEDASDNPAHVRAHAEDQARRNGHVDHVADNDPHRDAVIDSNDHYAPPPLPVGIPVPSTDLAASTSRPGGGVGGNAPAG